MLTSLHCIRFKIHCCPSKGRLIYAANTLGHFQNTLFRSESIDWLVTQTVYTPWCQGAQTISILIYLSSGDLTTLRSILFVLSHWHRAWPVEIHFREMRQPLIFLLWFCDSPHIL